MSNRIHKDTLDKYWSDDELDAMGLSGDPDDWTSGQYDYLNSLYLKANPHMVEPDRPGYKPVFDPKTMSIGPELQKFLDAIKIDSRGIDAFRNEALRKGPSNWARLMLQKQEQERLGAHGLGAKSVAGAAAKARAMGAMRGGMDSGAKRSLAREQLRAMFDMGQNVESQASGNRMQIGINDEQNRIQQLGMLPGMENQALQPQFQKAELWGKGKEFDTRNLLEEGVRANNWEMTQWQERMKLLSAEKQAQATENSGGSCWLITGLARFVQLPADEPELLTKFKAYVLREGLSEAKFYIRRCKPLVDRMDAANFNWPGFQWFNDGLVALLRAGEQQAAWVFFRTTVVDLIQKYWPECPHKAYSQMLTDRERQRKAANAITMPEVRDEDASLTAPCLDNLKPENFGPVNR